MFEPWYVVVTSQQFTRCEQCRCIVVVGDERCDTCKMFFDGGYWQEFSQRFGDDLAMFAPWMRMLCCNNPIFENCTCEVKVHPVLYGALRDWPSAPKVYKIDGECDDCMHQFTRACKPLQNMLDHAENYLGDPLAPDWPEYKIVGCEAYEERTDASIRHPSVFVSLNEES